MVKIFNKMKNYNCPICNKSGLEDYRKKEIKCPNCGSDLSVFVEIKQTTKRCHKLKIAIFATFFTASIFIIFLILSLNKTNENLNASLDRNIVLSDSLVIKAKIIKHLNDSIDSIQQTQVGNQDNIAKYYIVKKGDSFCRISYTLFRTEKFAKDIAELNGKDLRSLIFPGTKLLIPQN
jgi:DNA-directed RNA polymerase subunit RPC12/RpoP